MSEMKLLLTIILLSNVIINLEASAEDEERTPKWFWFRTITKYVQEKSVITKTLPSSCVVVEPTLPACRFAKQLSVEPTPTEKIEITKAPGLVESVVHVEGTPPLPATRFLYGSESVPNEWRGRENDTKPLSWAEYFGLGYVTVTKTVVHSVTAKYHDPSTVFSFHVRGCRPTALPFNLPLCDKNATSHPINSFSKEVHYAP